MSGVGISATILSERSRKKLLRSDCAQLALIEESERWKVRGQETTSEIWTAR